MVTVAACVFRTYDFAYYIVNLINRKEKTSILYLSQNAVVSR